MPEALPEPLVLRVPTDLALVRPTRKMVEGLLSGQGWSEGDVESAGLVVTEVVQNAIEHGSRGDGRETVEMRCRLEVAALVIEVEDPGTGKDPRAVLERDVTIPVPLDAPRGRGLYLIHRLAAALDRSVESGRLRIRVRLECEPS